MAPQFYWLFLLDWDSEHTTVFSGDSLPFHCDVRTVNIFDAVVLILIWLIHNLNILK